MKRNILFITILLLFTACEIIEPYDKIYYHDVEVEGYVYYKNEPIPNITITSFNSFKSKGYATIGPYTEEFTSGVTGYFCVKLIKRTRREDAIEYSIGFNNDTLYYYDNNNPKYYNSIPISPADLYKSKTNIQLGIIHLKKVNY